jgi:hypothetical protein
VKVFHEHGDLPTKGLGVVLKRSTGIGKMALLQF